MKDDCLRLTVYIALAALSVYLLVQLQMLFICIIAALTLASALSPLAEALERKKIPRVVTVILVYLLVLLTYTGVAGGLIPVLVQQAKSLWEHLPSYLDLVTAGAQKVTDMGGPDLAKHLNSEDARSVGLSMAQNAVRVTGNLVGFLVNAFFVLFLTAYFVISAKEINTELLRWLPLPHRERAAGLIRPLENRLGGYVRGQLLVSLAVGTVIGIGLAVIGNKYALILGVISGLLNLVPFVGSFITSVFAILVSFNQAPWMALATFGLFAFEQWLESNFIVPHLLGKQVGLHPLVVLLSVIIGASLLGLSGALIAVPVAAVSIFLAQEFYQKPLNAAEAAATANPLKD